MAVKIHHGAPGSYKTSGAVHEDFVAAVREGRHIVTNVRGLSDEDKVREVLEDRGYEVPDSFKLTHLDTTISSVMDQLRTFHHWSPSGIFFLLDEIQEVFPKRFKDKQLEKFDYHGDGEDRPATLELAFEKHRHHNWDFVVTSPNISKVHPLVRESAEGAYKHRNLAMLGSLFKGRYIEGFHPADTNGRKSDFYNIARKKIPSWVFNLYDSTATGEIRDTTAGQSIFKNPKLLFLLLVLFGAFGFAFSGGTPEFLKTPDDRKSKELLQGVNSSGSSSISQSDAPTFKGGIRDSAAVNSVPVDIVGDSKPYKVPIHLSFLDVATKIYNEGTVTMGNGYFYSLRFEMPDGAEIRMDHKKIRALGIKYHFVSKCFGVLQFKEFERAVTCAPPEPPPVYGEPATEQVDIFQLNQPDVSTIENPFI